MPHPSHALQAWAHYSKGQASTTFTATQSGYYMANCFMSSHEASKDTSASISTTGTTLAYMPMHYQTDGSTYTKGYSSACWFGYLAAGQSVTCTTGGTNVYYDCGINIALFS